MFACVFCSRAICLSLVTPQAIRPLPMVPESILRQVLALISAISRPLLTDCLRLQGADLGAARREHAPVRVGLILKSFRVSFAQFGGSCSGVLTASGA